MGSPVLSYGGATRLRHTPSPERLASRYGTARSRARRGTTRGRVPVLRAAGAGGRRLRQHARGLAHGVRVHARLRGDAAGPAAGSRRRARHAGRAVPSRLPRPDPGHAALRRHAGTERQPDGVRERVGRDQAPGAGGAGRIASSVFGVFRTGGRPLTMATVYESLFDLSLAAFASIGLPVTLLSSGYGFIRVLQRAPVERIGEAINSGAAFGFPPGSFLLPLYWRM